VLRGAGFTMMRLRHSATSVSTKPAHFLQAAGPSSAITQALAQLFYSDTHTASPPLTHPTAVTALSSGPGLERVLIAVVGQN
jgi:hypothetical protein